MDGPVVGAIITASVALVVAIGGAVRTTVQAAVDRRYERRRTALLVAQDAVLALREALSAYGVALHEQVSEANPSASLHVPSQAEQALSSSFALQAPQAVDLTVSAARGRLAVARSRVEDDRVEAAIREWEGRAQVSLIDTEDTQAASEEDAFARVNELVRSALRSPRALSRR